MKDLDRIKKLYKDWSSIQKCAKLDAVANILEASQKDPSNFVQFFEEMGNDGKTMKSLFESCWSDISPNKSIAKKKIATILIKESDDFNSLIKKDGSVVSDIGLSYMPIADMNGSTYGSNAMQSTISDGDRDILIQIRYAVTSGNYDIAQALILNFWNRLSVKERVDIFEWAMNIGKFNVYSDIPQSKGVSFKSFKEKLEKKEITKEEFVDKFLRTAKDKMKIE